MNSDGIGMETRRDDAPPSFGGLRVLTFESRRGVEIATLISRFGGRPILAPALREIPIESNTGAVAFAHALVAGQFDVVIFLTGVGARVLLAAVEPAVSREAFLAALGRVRVVVRGPKPAAVMRELGVPVWINVAEPNTWRELLAALDDRREEFPLAGARVAVQEYGVSNQDLVDGLRARGATVSAVPVYQWALPDDVGPIEDAVTALLKRDVDVALFLSGIQLVHLCEIARRMGREPETIDALGRTVLVSIGPVDVRRTQRGTVSSPISRPRTRRWANSSATPPSSRGNCWIERGSKACCPRVAWSATSWSR